MQAFNNGIPMENSDGGKLYDLRCILHMYEAEPVKTWNIPPQRGKLPGTTFFLFFNDRQERGEAERERGKNVSERWDFKSPVAPLGYYWLDLSGPF